MVEEHDLTIKDNLFKLLFMSCIILTQLFLMISLNIAKNHLIKTERQNKTVEVKNQWLNLQVIQLFR